MKAILSVMLISLSLLTSTSLLACCQPSLFSDITCSGLGCSCSDPACAQNNPCLSKDQCCAAFGNIGAIDQ